MFDEFSYVELVDEHDRFLGIKRSALVRVRPFGVVLIVVISVRQIKPCRQRFDFATQLEMVKSREDYGGPLPRPPVPFPP